METDQMKVWKGEFGEKYTERNTYQTSDEHNECYVARYGKSRDEINEELLAGVPRDIRVLEVGSNVGYQLQSLKRAGFTNLYGIEIQRHCVDKAKKLWDGIDIIEASGFDIPYKDNNFDLVFTNNVLIHFSPADISKVIDEMHRVTKEYIFGFEYYEDKITEINYRGNTNLLWKANYSGIFQERHPDLTVVREKFYDCLDDKGMKDKAYLLRKNSA